MKGINPTTIPVLFVLALLVQSTILGAPLHNQYRIELDLDYQKATFTGRQTVRFVNNTRGDLDNVSFHLYPNIGLPEGEALWLSIGGVKAGTRELKFSLRARNTVLRVDLPNKIGAGQSVELTLNFAARLPRVQREEASLLAHFLQEVNDAMSDERQPRDARDIFFAGDEAMMLGYFYPLLAARQSQAAQQSSSVGVGGIAFSEVADYDVTIKTTPGLTVVASGVRTDAQSAADASGGVHHFRGEQLRGFGVAVAERLQHVEEQVGKVRVVSYFRDSDEKMGRKALTIGARAVAAYVEAFGDYPYPELSIVELPLPAGYSGVELSALVVLAQAYFIDFDAIQSLRLPGVLREQTDVIKSAFEFTVASGIAHQWWGEAVGSDPERSPYLEHALANFSATYYHEVAYGKQLGELIIEQQLRGAYQAYRMLGGNDTEVDKSAKDYRNALHFTAIVQAKGALLFVALRREMGDERFFHALRYYFTTHRFHIAAPDHLRYAFQAAAEDPKVVRGLFQRWIRSKHGDEDIGAPELSLAPAPPNSKMRAMGRVFVKIGRTAARPF